MDARRRTRGSSLVELVVAMLVLGVIGTALVRFIVAQSRGYEAQDAAQQARKAARAAVNLLTSELRMVEVSGGVTAASATSLTVRAPYAIGVVCDSAAITTIPVDSVMFAQATFGGYAWRDSIGAYTYVTTGASVASAADARCTAASITEVPGGRTLALAPPLPAAATVGRNVFLFQTITYAFAPSVLMPGRTGLWRQAGNATEEIAAPFDSATTRFRFFVLNGDTAQTAVPASLATIRGVELAFTGASRRTPRWRTSPKTAATTNAVFFQNRLN